MLQNHRNNKKDNNNIIHHGDCLEKLKELESDSIDCIVTDPPYGYSFMNKDWDKAVVSVDVWKECLRVMKAGSFAFIMSSPRQDVLCKMILNLIDAGFETNFSSMYHTYASGFPKAANTSKLLQKRGLNNKEELNGSYLGFQPKPALETILVVMKPLSEKTFVDQALKNCKGITWLDSCRIPYQSENDRIEGQSARDSPANANLYEYGSKNMNRSDRENLKGRFPANVLCEGDSLNDGKITQSDKYPRKTLRTSGTDRNTFGGFDKQTICPNSYNDSGSYSRYFSLDAWYSAQFIITPKASASERNKGLENEPLKIGDGMKGTENQSLLTGSGNIRNNLKLNHHPTVKPIKLMSYLITLGSRPNDIILDPFCGSGTTCIAALQLGRKFIGIEKEKEYVEIAQKRIEPYLLQSKLTNY